MSNSLFLNMFQAHVGTQWLLPLSLLAIVLFRVTLTTSHKPSRIPDSIGGIAILYEEHV